MLKFGETNEKLCGLHWRAADGRPGKGMGRNHAPGGVRRRSSLREPELRYLLGGRRLLLLHAYSLKSKLLTSFAIARSRRQRSSDPHRAVADAIRERLQRYRCRSPAALRGVRVPRQRVNRWSWKRAGPRGRFIVWPPRPDALATASVVLGCGDGTSETDLTTQMLQPTSLRRKAKG
jgi:hypothetical protein